MANVNGVVSLKLQGTEYVLATQYKAVLELENGTDDDMNKLFDRLANNHLTTIIKVLKVALKHSGYKDFTEEKLGEAVVNAGIKAARTAAQTWLLTFMVAPDDIKQTEGEAQPVPTV